MNKITTEILFHPIGNVVSTGWTENTIRDMIFSQIEERNITEVSVKTKFEKLKIVNCPEIPKAITIESRIDTLTNRVPIISYIPAQIGRKQEIAISIKITASDNIDGSKFYRWISYMTHNNFVGLKEYIDHTIVLDISVNKSKLDLYFNSKSKYIPVILFIHLPDSLIRKE